MEARAAAYAASPWGQRFPESVPRVGREQGRAVLYGIWVIGNDYRNPTQFYGAYPKGLLPRAQALFPDLTNPVQRVADRLLHTTLHVFSGSLPPGPYDRCDLVQPAEHACSVYELPARFTGPRYRLLFADPPYSATDAERYGTAMVNRGKAMRALAQVTLPGGYLCWLDTVWPMHTKRQWVTVGRIFVQRSTNHRVRVLSIFERMP